MNLLPLATWFDLMGFHPWHSAGIAGTNQYLQMQNGCDTLIRRYAWQNSDAASQVEIAQAIESAEAKLTGALGYSPAPHYVSETIPWPARADRLLRGGAWQADGRYLNLQLTEGEIRAVGVETLASISIGAAVTYSDVDGDGINETFTISAATTITDPSEIAVYFSSGDRFTGWGDLTTLSPRWRLQPIRVVISGGTVTITGAKTLCVKPSKYEGVVNIGADGLDVDTAANFVTTLDIYRRYTGTDGNTVSTSQAVITWETRPSHGWWCCCGCQSSDPYNGSPYDPAATAQAVARVGIRDGTAGLVFAAESAYDATTATWSALDWAVCDVPDRVTVRYLAGFPLGADGQMQEPFRAAVARLAAAELARPVCGCDDANRELYRWQFDLGRIAGANDEQYAISPGDLANPFGTRRGHVHAWKLVQRYRQLRGFTG